MLVRKLRARIAESHALKLRTERGISPNYPANPYDIAVKSGIDVLFLALPSVEGVYIPHGGPRILISSLRPAGRQSFTCAHELGHHKLQHGEKIDELIESRRTERINDLDEFQADTFASFLLMPRAAVAHAFNARGWRVEAALPEQFYQIAQWLGVGYSTLIGHVSRQLKMLSWSRADELMRKNLKAIRASLFGKSVNGAIYLVDQHWATRTIDCEIGDVLLLPRGSVFSGVAISIAERRPTAVVAIASEAGLSDIQSGDGWGVRVRVGKKGYTGRYVYKFLEETPLEE